MMMSITLSHINERQVEFEGKALLYFGGCDYLRLSRHPEVVACLQASAEKAGHISVGASRSTTGNHAIFESLERELAAYLSCEAAVLTGAGYLANLSLAAYFREHASHLIIDSRAHSSLKDAARLSELPMHFYQHRNVGSAAEICKKLQPPTQCFLLTDGVFGLDGTTAPLSNLHALLPEEIGFVIDDAHGFGVMGMEGKGTGSEIDWGCRPIIRTISLAKTLGCHGGAVAGSQHVIETIHSRSPVWSGHTPFPVSLGEACSVSLSKLAKDRTRHRRLNENLNQMGRLIKKSTAWPSIKLSFPVVSFVCDRMENPNFRAEMERIFIQHGIFPSIIRYPGISERLLIRLAICSEHALEDLKILVAALESLNAAAGLIPFFLSDSH